MYGIPQKYVNIFRNFYLNSSCCVRMDSVNTELFKIVTGIFQSCLLMSALFLLVVDFIKQKTVGGLNFGIWQREEMWVTDLDFADGITLLAKMKDELQELTYSLEKAAKGSAWGSVLQSQRSCILMITKT